jgi:hypothetical protein
LSVGTFSKRAQLAGGHVLGHLAGAHGHRVDMAAQQRHHGRRGPEERNVVVGDAGLVGERGGGHVPDRADARVADGDRLLAGARIGHELLDGLPRRIGAHGDGRGIGVEARDGAQVGGRELGDAQVGNDGQLDDDDADLVAVGLGRHQLAHADGAARAGLVVDDHRLLRQVLLGRLGEGAAHHVGAAPRRHRHDDLDRPVRIVGSAAGEGGPGQREGAGGGDEVAAMGMHGMVS